MDRQQFIYLGGAVVASLSLSGFQTMNYFSEAKEDMFFDISLAQWSLHRSLFEGELDHLDFPETAKKEFGISAVEYVSQFFADKADDISYLNKMNSRCSDLGIDQVLIMIDGEGELAVTDEKKRNKAVENHYKWVEAAKYLGCHSIRVNTYGDGTPKEQKNAAVESLRKLCSFAADREINILVENHGGYSSNGQWLTDVINEVGMANCGLLPDFGNFCIKREDIGTGEDSCAEQYNMYKGVEEMMPYAHGVSAKSYDFNERGQEKTIDYRKMLQIIYDSSFNGYIGIEYEGNELSEFEGIRKTKKLLEDIGSSI